jgi:deoxyribodipyrimidine photo-lyase
VHIYWLKRDLRWTDNPVLLEACARKTSLILLYIFDKEQCDKALDWDIRHWRFVHQSLMEMQQSLVHMGGGISIFYGYCEEVFTHLLDHYEVKGVLSHEEVGNALSYARDVRMKAFFKKRGILWQEFPHNGIIRGLSHRRDWASHHQNFLSQRPFSFPNPAVKSQFLLAKGAGVQQFPSALWQALTKEDGNFQIGGGARGKRVLEHFVEKRAHNYLRHIAKPGLSRESCSRISPYLAYGNLSVREVYHVVARACQEEGGGKRDFSGFLSRLHWQGHFIQKFETLCAIEVENMNPAYDRLHKPLREDWIEKWQLGKTGYPLVDACMRCLVHTGYLNFRMRALLVSFLTHHLWQDWRSGVHHLARQFLDYEPGIHYSQFQMQASTTGINMPRVYNPVKQSIDQDPQADFIKEWVPELGAVPVPLVHQPWRLSAMEQILYHCRLGEDYPWPLVDYQKSAKYAVETLWSFRKSRAVKEENQKILGVLTQRKKGD